LKTPIIEALFCKYQKDRTARPPTNPNGVSSSIISAVRASLSDQLSAIAKRPFDGASIHIFEKQFVETIGQSGSRGLSQLLCCNDESRKIVIVNGQKHYRKYATTGRYLTLLGEISLKRGIYQSNMANRSIWTAATRDVKQSIIL
jgi:hypothetical protein